MTTYFVVEFDMIRDIMTLTICVSIPVGELLVVDRVYQSCLVSFAGYDTWIDLIILGMVEYDIILGMNWILFIMMSLIVKLRI